VTPLPRSFYADKTVRVAKALLGQLLVRTHAGQVQIARIVETEAYVGEHDLASHSRKGITPRTKPMFGEPGHAYVYLIYGMYSCFNVVTEPVGKGAAVLIRGVEPVAHVHQRTDGPGRLTRALAIDRTLSAIDLCERGPLFIAAGDSNVGKILRGPRIGVDYAGSWAQKPLRFWAQNSAHVSKDRQARASK
jgi:DNA-3-methyladenine glycosylase